MGITEVSMAEALLIALSGILVVFLMLAILSVVIKGISAVSAEKTGNAPNAGAAAAGTANAVTGAAAGTSIAGNTAAADVPYGGTIKLLNVDEKTAACVMAIVSHETGIPLNQLIFKSIKGLNE